MLYCHLLIHAEIYIYILDTYRRSDKDAGRLLYKYIPFTLLQGFEKGYSRFLLWAGVGDRTETAILWPHSYGRQRCVFLVLLMLNQRPRGPFYWVMAFFTASYHQLLWSPNSIGVPEGPFSRVWLSLPHLVYNSVRTPTATVRRLSWLSYIIVQRSLSRLLDFWNRMLDRHQAEITVMQFTGHSLPVHQSMSVPWEFFTSSHFISQFPPTRFPLITAIRVCHLLPVHHLGMAFLAGSKAKIQQLKRRGS